MRKTVIFIAGACFVIAGLFLVACASNLNGNASKNSAANVEAPITADGGKPFKLEFTSQPGEITAETPSDLIFTIKDKQGTRVKDLKIVHEKPMHLIIVSSDLAEFYHIHPEPQANGSLRVSNTFPNGGDFKLYADFTPTGSTQVVEQIDIKVAGAQRPKTALVPDTKFEKTVDGLKVVMKPSADLKAGQELTLDFGAFDATSGKPATDLENYLGELAHFVLISEDLKDFVHAHPMSKGQKMDSMKMGDDKKDDHGTGDHHSKMAVAKKQSVSEVSAHTTFPRAGLYKVWAQFQRGGKVIAVPFIVKVSDPETKTAENDPGISAYAIKVTVSSDGYTPSSINVKKGQPVKLAFFRKDANNCGGEVVFEKLNIRKKLPVGKTVLVEFVPKDDDEIAFACGMGMMKGKVVVQ